MSGEGRLEEGAGTPREAPDRRIGEVLAGRYRVVAPLDAGGTARVYLAIQEPLGREVAVKVLRPDMDPDQQESFEPRFFREAALLGALSHANLVTVHDYGRTADGACFVVMERMRGRTLRQALADGPFRADEAVRLVIGVARGLRYAHQQGLVHRDVKPSNVFLVVDEGGVEQPKLLDFGLVKNLRNSESTSVGTFLGTPHYVAPEQATGKPIDARADIYATGVLLYRMLAGVLPYDADNAMAVALAHVREPYPPIRTRAPEAAVDPSLEALVRRMMAKDPVDRPSDMGEVIHDLEAWLAGRPVARGARRPPVWLIGGVAVVLAAIGVVLGLRLGGPLMSSPQPPASEVPLGSVASEPAAVPAAPAAPLIPTETPATPQAPTAAIPTEDVAWGERTEPITVTPAPTPSGASVSSTSKPRSAVRASAAPSSPPAAAPSPTPTPVRTLHPDGVPMTEAEAASAVKFLNTASEAELRAAGVPARYVGTVLEQRPFASIQAAADTPYIGEKTIQAARDAGGR